MEPNEQHIAFLQENPQLASKFDDKFGPGASRQYLERDDEGIVEAVARGVGSGVNQFAASVVDLGADIVGADVELPTFIDRPTSTTGRVVEGITQFGMGFVPGLGAARLVSGGVAASRLGQAAQAAGGGAIADFISFQEHEERLSNIINESDTLRNPVTEYLAAAPDDGWAEGRMKNVLEGALIGTAADVLVAGVRALKAGKVAKDAGGDEAADRAIREATSDIEAKVNRFNEEKPRFVKRSDGTFEEAISGAELPEIPEGTITKTAIDELAKNRRVVNQREINRRAALVKEGKMSREEAFHHVPFAAASQPGRMAEEALVTLEEVSAKILDVDPDAFSKPQNFDTVRELALQYEKDPAELIKGLRDLGVQREEAPARLLAGLATTESLLREIPTISRKIAKAELPEEKFDEAVTVLGNFIEGTKALNTLAGRTVAANRIANDADLIKGGKKALEVFNITGDKAAFVRQINRLNNPHPGVLRQIFGKVFKGKSWDIVNEVFINSILSGPKTHITNIVSTGIKTLVTPLEDAAGQVIMGNFREAGRAIGQYGTLKQELRESLRLAKAALTGDAAILDPGAGTRDFNERAIGGATGKVVNAPTRALTAEDEFFKQMNYRTKLRSLGEQAADARKLTGENRRDFVENYVKEGFDEKGRGINETALEYAREQTFTSPLTYGLGKVLQSGAQEVPGLRLILPFVRTPTNLLRDAWEHTPGLGLIGRRNREKLLRGTPEEKARIRGKQLLGSIIVGTGISYAAEGRLTGGGPGDHRLRKQMMDAGWRPYSIRIGDTYHEFRRLDPFSTVLAVMADVAETVPEMSERQINVVASGLNDAITADLLQGNEEFDIGELSPGDMLFGAARSVFNKTYLTGLSNLFEALGDNEPDRFDRFLRSQAAAFVPNILNQGFPDDHLREVQSFTEAFKARTPGFRNELAPRYNFMGQPAVKTGSPWAHALSPFGDFSDAAEGDPVSAETARLKQGFTPLAKVKYQADLTTFRDGKGRTAYEVLNDMIDGADGRRNNLRADLQKLISSAAYRKLQDNPPASEQGRSLKGSRVEAIRRVIKKHRDVAWAKLDKDQFRDPEGNALADAPTSKRAALRLQRGDQAIDKRLQRFIGN